MFKKFNFFCQEKHKHWTSQIVNSNTSIIYNGHYSSHMFDVYTFYHMYFNSLMYILLQFIIDSYYAIIYVLLLSTFFEIYENNSSVINRYNLKTSKVDLNKFLLDDKNDKLIFKNKKNGLNYNIQIFKNYVNIYQLNSPNVIKFIKLNEYADYNISLYRGDSLLNILGDIVANTTGILVTHFTYTLHPLFGFIIHSILTFLAAIFSSSLFNNVVAFFI